MSPCCSPPWAGRDRTSASRPRPLLSAKNGASEAAPAATAFTSDKGVAVSHPMAIGINNDRTAIFRITDFPARCTNVRRSMTAPPGGGSPDASCYGRNSPFKGARENVNSVSACVQ
ncbi:hypothetical protein GCM10010451_66820 [Streptomyces virens]|uniref:Uncharacterized protein n=1 Tax=Streptomyces virens TaxID=285572 RepID=A0ABN3V349_9ACTN